MALLRAPTSSVDHLVVGGGAVGLAVAASLVSTAGKRSTLVVEQRPAHIVQSRPSIIHSGIHYPIGSLKSKLGIRGRDLLYKRCAALGIAHRKTEKIIVATDKYEIPYLDALQTLSVDPRLALRPSTNPYENNSAVPAFFLSGDEARGLEPDLGPDVCAALLVTEAGVVDHAGVVASLEKEISGGLDSAAERGEGVVVNDTKVVGIDNGERDGWVVQLQHGDGEGEAVHANVVVLAAGHEAPDLLSRIVPERERIAVFPCHGHYLSYNGPGVANVSRLIHPCPSPQHRGARLTLDLDGNVHFGPDLLSPDATLSHDRIGHIAAAVQAYLPNVDPAGLTPRYTDSSYTLQPLEAGFADCIVRHSPDRRGLIELYGGIGLGITGALATGEHVAAKVSREVWGDSIAKMAEGWE